MSFIPQGTDPTSLKAGDTFRVALIEGKRLVRDLPIALVREGSGRVAVVKPDQNGIASFVVTQPGRYMVTATALRRSKSKEVDWTSDFNYPHVFSGVKGSAPVR